MERITKEEIERKEAQQRILRAKRNKLAQEFNEVCKKLDDVACELDYMYGCKVING